MLNQFRGKIKFFLLYSLFASCIIRAQKGPACASVPNNQFVRNSRSCSAYYYCRNEVAIDANCPSPYVFNAQTQTCDSIYNVDCRLCSRFGIQNIEDPNNCRRYFRCVGGVRTQRICAIGLVFDPKIGDCNLPSIAPCDKSDDNFCEYFSDKSFIQIGDPSDCTRFYTCIFGITYRQTCGPGLYFNAHEASCQRPGDFNFCQDYGDVITPAPNQPTTQLPWNTTTPSPTTAVATTTRAAATTTAAAATTTRAAATTTASNTSQTAWTTGIITTTTVRVDDVRCVRKNGYFVVEGSCVDYVYCIQGVVRFEFVCPDGEWYNKDYEKCLSTRPDGC